MKISVCAPMYNESFLLPYWLKSVSQFADEIVLTDGGSKDDSRAFVKEYATICPIPINLEHIPQNAQAFSDNWAQGRSRNELLNRCQGDIIMPLDIDEILDPKDGPVIRGLFENSQTNSVDLIWITFWKDLQHVRVSTPWDIRWYGVPVTKAIRKGSYQYTDEARHCHLIPTAEEPGRIRTAIPLYHIHYAFGIKRIKDNDNRAFDLRGDRFDNAVGSFGPIYTLPYEGPWPDVIKP